MGSALAIAGEMLKSRNVAMCADKSLGPVCIPCSSGALSPERRERSLGWHHLGAVHLHGQALTQELDGQDQ